jgi:hypothetical protein
MQNPEHGLPLQASSSAAESDAATEHIAVGAGHPQRDHGLHLPMEWKPNVFAEIAATHQNDIRNLCNSWQVKLRAQSRYRPMETIKQELKMALTKRAMKLKSETEASTGGAPTEHAETEVRADDTLAETPRSSSQVAAESTATEHASAELRVAACAKAMVSAAVAASFSAYQAEQAMFKAFKAAKVAEDAALAALELVNATSGDLASDAVLRHGQYEVARTDKGIKREMEDWCESRGLCKRRPVVLDDDGYPS